MPQSPLADLFPWLDRGTATNGHETQTLLAIAGPPETSYDDVEVAHLFHAVEHLLDTAIFLLQHQSGRARNVQQRALASVAREKIAAALGGEEKDSEE